MAKVNVVLSGSCSSVATVLLLKSLLSYTLFRINSDLYKKTTPPRPIISFDIITWKRKMHVWF